MALLVVGMGLASSASAILLDRGPDMVYDTVLDITWTRQAGDGVARNWADANAWAAGLVFGGFSDWRLPWASVSAGAGPITTLTFGQPCTGAGGADEVGCRDNEMAYMFYYNLDGTFGSPETGTQTAVGGEVLTGIQTLYWSGTEFDSAIVWDFLFLNGNQFNVGKSLNFVAWAVRPGDVAAVPEPGSLLLLGLGAVGLGWSRRRKS